MAGAGDLLIYRTWQGALAERAAAGSGGAAMSIAAPAAQNEEAGPEMSAGVYYAGPVVDREAGEGPPRCCPRRRVLADKLVWYGGISDEALARVRARLPHLAEVARDDLYLCSGCILRLLREGVIRPDEIPRR